MDLYERTARCRDLPELVDERDGEFVLAFPSGALERVVAAVAGRRAPGAILQEKIDGCWCAMRIGAGGRVESVTSRSGIHLRVAVGWIGERVRHQLAGWTLIGEVEAGTHWASTHRDEGRVPLLHLYGAIDVSGNAIKSERVQSLPAWLGHPRIVPIPQAGPRDDWAEWTRRVLDAGGEGVVIRDADGNCWRAKTRMTVDRVVSSVYTKPDRTGAHRLFADLAAYKGGRKRVVQTVLVPEDMQFEKLRGRVVVVVGASMEATTGVVRHARISELRPKGEKSPADCKL